ncbi:MAG: 30S ribosomal protein S2 [Candidatus Hydrogenedentes bacterium]|nr:30S ribosomal protein S2 [Candidatus Hydrogenedentota bacterium]
MAVASMRDLLEAGIHFGHQTRRWNPKMAKYIFGQRNGIYIIDLQKTLRQLRKAYAYVRDTVAAGGTVLFVGTKRQAQEPIQREATRCGMYYVNTRWLGGTLTNFSTVKQSVRTLLRYDDMEANGEFDKLSKKESSRLRKYHAKLKKNLSGIKSMDTLPKVMFVIDSKKETIAIREANRLDIMCVGVVDTNCDPDAVPLPIPGNDDAIRAVNLFCSVIADAALEGLAHAEKVRAEDMARKGQMPPSAAVAEAVAEAAAAGNSLAAAQQAADAAEADTDMDETDVEGDE